MKPYPCPAAPSRFSRACVTTNLQSAQETLAEIEKAMHEGHEMKQRAVIMTEVRTKHVGWRRLEKS